MSFNLTGLSYAHRGLWDGLTPENSMTAFRKAAQAGLGAECDVHLSSDGVPMVFHDATLDRMTGQSGRLADTSSDLLKTLFLSATTETIPTLRDVLTAMAGLPLLIEVKSTPDTSPSALAQATAGVLKDVAAPHAVMSFDPNVLTAFAETGLPCQIGLLLDPTREPDLNFLRDFIRYARISFLGPHVFQFDLATKIAAELGLETVCWTVRTEADFLHVKAAGAAPIFENLPLTLVRPSMKL